MPVTTGIEPKSGLVVHTVTGELTVSDAVGALERLYPSPDLWSEAGAVGAVWDLRNASLDALQERDLREIVAFVEKHRPSRPGMTAFVTSREVDFGISRVYEALADSLPVATQVFRDWDEALDWAAAGEGLEDPS